MNYTSIAEYPASPTVNTLHVFFCASLVDPNFGEFFILSDLARTNISFVGIVNTITLDVDIKEGLS